MSAIHYVVQNNPFGTYDNIELFDFLVENGFDFNVKNN